MTPYLDDIIENPNQKGHNPRYITLRHRSYCWYYVFNNHNKTDAYRRAYYSHVDNKTGKIVMDISKAAKRINMGVLAALCSKKIYNQVAIKKLEEVIEEQIKSILPTDLLRQMVIQATYDPSMFVNLDGSPKYTDWDDIPPEYRCCIEGIETKVYGRDGQEEKVVTKLVDRDKSRKYLLQMCPSLLEPVTHKHIVTTIDDEGKETGIDFAKMDTEKLKKMEKELIQELKREGVLKDKK